MLYITALIIFLAVHVIPLNQKLRNSAMDKLGGKRYLGLFVLVVLASIVMMAQGWNHFPNIYFYEPGPLMKHVHLAIMLPVVYLWVAAEIPNNLKRFIRHPMLTGMKLWALGHLLANGDLRSMLLFISILLFSTIAVIVINKRGEYKKIKPMPIAYDISVIAISVISYSTMVYFHGNLFGVQVMSYFI